MSTTESTERKTTRTIEKVVMSFMYLLFGVILLAVALSGELAGLFVVLPIAIFSIGLTKWGIKWQNDRYIRSAKNVDAIEVLSVEVRELKKRIENLEEK
tara:strand:+ start:91 stop:387 length:297 start_codon:yes stop_codon:yes gene_type:complete